MLSPRHLELLQYQSLPRNSYQQFDYGISKLVNVIIIISLAPPFPQKKKNTHKPHTHHKNKTSCLLIFARDLHFETKITIQHTLSEIRSHQTCHFVKMHRMVLLFLPPAMPMPLNYQTPLITPVSSTTHFIKNIYNLASIFSSFLPL